jgi:Arc/MetJ family transcription regulator
VYADLYIWCVRTNIDLDDQLIKQAQKLSKAVTKKEAVNQALDYYVRYHMSVGFAHG